MEHKQKPDRRFMILQPVGEGIQSIAWMTTNDPKMNPGMQTDVFEVVETGLTLEEAQNTLTEINDGRWKALKATFDPTADWITLASQRTPIIDYRNPKP